MLFDWAANTNLATPVTSQSDTTIGIYRGMIGARARVFVGDGDITVALRGRYRPWPGDPVVLDYIGGAWRVTGPAQAKSKQGVLKTVGYPTVTVTVETRDYVMGYNTQLTDLHVGDHVVVNWDEVPYVDSKITATATADPEPTITTEQKKFELIFNPTDSGSYRNGKWWTNDVYGDSQDNGAWFYGSKIRTSLRDDAHIDSVDVFLSLRTRGKGLPKIGRHTAEKRPGGNISISDAATRKKFDGWVSLPIDWAETWRASNGGVAIGDGGGQVYRGVRADRQSGRLRIRGRQ